METRQSSSAYLESIPVDGKVRLFGDIWLTSSARGKREEKPTSIIHGNAIDLNTLDIKPTNIFFSSGNGDVTPNSNGEIELLSG
jgi:hypothetical protein